MLKETTIHHIADNMICTLKHYATVWEKLETHLQRCDVALGKSKDYCVANAKDIDATIEEVTTKREKIRKTCFDKTNACFNLITEYEEIYRMEILKQLKDECYSMLEKMANDN